MRQSVYLVPVDGPSAATWDVWHLNAVLLFPIDIRDA